MQWKEILHNLFVCRRYWSRDSNDFECQLSITFRLDFDHLVMVMLSSVMDQLVE